MSGRKDDAAFPKLTEQELSCVAQIGTARKFKDGDVLIEAGTRDYSFYAVRSGEVVIVESSTGTPREVTVHKAGEFTGDVDILTGRPALISAIARGECEVYEVPGSRIRQLLNEVPDLSDKLLEAFQTRRELLWPLGSSASASSVRPTCGESPGYGSSAQEQGPAPSGTSRRMAGVVSTPPAPLRTRRSPPATARLPPSLVKFAECLGIAEIPDELFDVRSSALTAGLAAYCPCGIRRSPDAPRRSGVPRRADGPELQDRELTGLFAGASGVELGNEAISGDEVRRRVPGAGLGARPSAANREHALIFAAARPCALAPC